MEEKDVAALPDWSLPERPPSSTATSITVSAHPKKTETSSLQSSTKQGVKDIVIYPFETSTSRRLVDLMHNANSLQTALQQAVEAIQRHAKWFTKADLENLLRHALLQASESTSTADLDVALDLVDVVATFATLPRTCLATVAAFISFTYYQGTRTHRHKNLAKKAWTILEHLLHTHLGTLGIAALLDVLNKEEALWSRASFATVSGALRLIEEKLPIGGSSQAHIPAVPVFELLSSLQHVVAEADEILKEQVIVVLDRILSDDAASAELDSMACWEKFLALVQACDISPGNENGQGLLRRIASYSHLLEPRLLENMAALFVDAEHQFPDVISQHIMTPFQISHRLQGDDTSPHDRLLHIFCRDNQHQSDLHKIVESDLEFLACSNERQDWVQLIEQYMKLLRSSETVVEAAISCASAMCALLHFAMERSENSEQNWKVTHVFDAVTDLVVSATHPEARLCALRTLSRLRATISGRVFLEEDEVMEGSLAESTMPGRVFVSDLPKNLWLGEVLSLIGQEDTEESQMCASFVVMALPDQLSNLSLFADETEFIRALFDTVAERLTASSSASAAGFVRILAALISYHDLLSQAEKRQMVEPFIKTAGSADNSVSRDCIHALTICCYEMPDTVARELNNIIQKMAQMVTQKQLAIHVLEFLTGLSRLPNLFKNFRLEDYRKVFGVCISYLQSLRAPPLTRPAPETDNSSSSNTGAHEIMPQYVYALAHHVIVFWYITLRQSDRQPIRTYVTNSLSHVKQGNTEVPDEQGLVVVDFMDRVDAEDAISTESRTTTDSTVADIFEDIDGRILVQHRICGMMLISTHTSLRTAKTLVITRRPSGTAKYIMFGRDNTQRDSWPSARLSTYAPSIWSGSTAEDETVTVYSDDPDGSVYGSVAIPPSSSLLGSAEVVVLEEDPALDRAIFFFDRTPALDSHKAGVLYIGEGQTTETEILSNSSGSPDYKDLIERLGKLQKLRGAPFNTQGLDTQIDNDGRHVIVWNNEITELVFHVTTMMPTDQKDVQMSVVSKKRHVGNDFVNIVFNNSGLPFRFDTLPSAFNYVYIVITPSVRTTFLQTRTHTMNISESHRFYRVEVLTRDDFPAISSAAEPKMISGTSLPGYVRNLALNACVFSEVWVNRDGSEYYSSWRTRLNQIRRLRERHTPRWPEPERPSIGTKGKRNISFWK